MTVVSKPIRSQKELSDTSHLRDIGIGKAQVNLHEMPLITEMEDEPGSPSRVERDEPEAETIAQASPGRRKRRQQRDLKEIDQKLEYLYDVQVQLKKQIADMRIELDRRAGLGTS